MARQLPALTHSLLRVMSAFLLIPHGAQKLFGWFGGSQVELLSQKGIGGVLEFYGGLLLLVGFMTRPVAFLLSGMMAVAYFQFHAGRDFWPILNKGEPAVLYCFVFLFLAAAGGGKWSIDDLRKGKSRSS